MSFSINNQQSANRPMTLKERTLDYGKKGLGLGIAAGVIEGSVRKTWLNKGVPNDAFEKQVIINMEKALPPEEFKAVKKINKFFADLADPEVKIADLKEQLSNSDELKSAIQLKENETHEQAIERIFAKDKNKSTIKNELRELQERTILDKKVDKTAAKKLIKANFNSEKKTLQKAATTSEEMFKVLKKSANKVRFNRGVIDTLIGAFIGGVGGMLIGSSQKKDKKQ